MSEVFHSIYISYTNEHQKRKKLSLRNSNQNCWGAEKPCSKRLALDTSQSFLTCKGVRGLFCLRYVKESGRVNTTVWVSTEVWSGLLRAEGILGSHISREVALAVVNRAATNDYFDNRLVWSIIISINRLIWLNQIMLFIDKIHTIPHSAQCPSNTRNAMKTYSASFIKPPVIKKKLIF